MIIAMFDEAILYLRSILFSTNKVIAMRYSWDEKKQKTLAEYFCEKKGHLLGDISVCELDDHGDFSLIREGK